MNVDVDPSVIPPLAVFEEPLASFASFCPSSSSQTSPLLTSTRTTGSTATATATNTTTTSATGPVPLVVKSLCFDEVASDVVLLTNENTICFYHLTLCPSAATAPPTVPTRLGALSSGSPPPPPLHVSTTTQQLAHMTDLALCLTVQRRLAPSVRRPHPSSRASAGEPDAHAVAVVPVRAARRCPTIFYARTTGTKHTPQHTTPRAMTLADAEASSALLAYQIVAVSCEESAIYLYRCMNAQSELAEAALTTLAGHSSVPLAAFAVYQCVPNNLRFSDPCYAIRSFYWVIPSDGAHVVAAASRHQEGGDTEASGAAEALTVDDLGASAAPRLLCITSVGLDLIRLGTTADLDAVAHHQSTCGAEGLPTVLTLLHTATASPLSSSTARTDDFARSVFSGWALQERYPTRIQHWLYHPTTRLVLTLRDSESSFAAVQRADRGAPSGGTMASPDEPALSVVLKPFEVSPRGLRPMCRLELPLHACRDLVHALHEERQSTTATAAASSPRHASPLPPETSGGGGEDPRMLASTALGAHVGVLLLYGKVFLFHVVARDAVMMLYQYHPTADSTTSGAPHRASTTSATTTTTTSTVGLASSFHVTHANASPSSFFSGAASPSHASPSHASKETAESETYVRRLALDLRGFDSFRRYRACYEAREASRAFSAPAAAPSPPSLVVQVSDNMLLLHAPDDAMSATFDVAGLSACVEVEQMIPLPPTGVSSMTGHGAAAGTGPLCLRLNAVVGRHARAVSLPITIPLPRPSPRIGLPATSSSSSASLMWSDGGEDWVSVAPSGMPSRVGSAMPSLEGDDRASASWTSASATGRLAPSWTGTRSAPTSAASSASVEEHARLNSATPRHRVPVGLHIYTSTRLALLPDAARCATKAQAAPPQAPPASAGRQRGSGLSWLFDKLPPSLTGLGKNGQRTSATSMFGQPTALCRAELQEDTPVPLLPALVTAPLVPYAVSLVAAPTSTHPSSTHRPPESPLRRWYTACRFSRDCGSLPLLFDVQKVVAPSSTPAVARALVLFSVHVVMVNPFAVAAAASAQLSEPFVALASELAGVDDDGADDDDPSSPSPRCTHRLTGHDVAWRLSFYLRRLFCAGETVPRMLRTMLRCAETTAPDSGTVYSPEMCSSESVAAALAAVVAQQAHVRAARQAHAAAKSRLQEGPAVSFLSEWEVYPGPVLGMSSAAFLRALQLAAQARLSTTTGAAAVSRRRGGRVFTNHPQRVQEAVAYLAHFTAASAVPSDPACTRAAVGGFLTLPELLATCLLPPTSTTTAAAHKSAPASPVVDMNLSASDNAAGVPLRVYRSFQQHLLTELVLQPAIQHAQAWAQHERQTRRCEENNPHSHSHMHRTAPCGLPMRPPDPTSPCHSLAVATAGMSTASTACRERFAFLLSVLLAYSAALRDVGELLSEDVQNLIVTALLASFPGSLTSLARDVYKSLRRGLLLDRLSTALRLLQYRDAWVAAQVLHAHGGPVTAPVRLLGGGGFDPQSIQDPVSTIVMGMLARCGGAYERITVWLRRHNPLRAARDLCRYAATVLREDGPTAANVASGASSSVGVIKAAEEDWNLLLASQDILQCAASSVDEAEMGLMGPRRWSGVLNASMNSPHRPVELWSSPHSNINNTNGSNNNICGVGMGPGATGNNSTAGACTQHRKDLTAYQEHASRKSRQIELQARRKEFVLVFQLLNGLVKSRIDSAYARRALLEAQSDPTTSPEDAAGLNAVLTCIQVAERMEAKMLEYERRFIAVLHS